MSGGGHGEGERAATGRAGRGQGAAVRGGQFGGDREPAAGQSVRGCAVSRACSGRRREGVALGGLHEQGCGEVSCLAGGEPGPGAVSRA